MTRRKVAIFCASALAIGYSYQIAVDVANGADMQWLKFILLGLALVIVAVEIKPAKKPIEKS